MTIRLAMIPTDALACVIREANELRGAVNSGDMDVVEAATEKLVALTETMCSIDITEEEWRRFLTEVRAENAAFQADYIVPGHLCSRFFPDATLVTKVLQLPLNERETNDV